MKKELFAYMKRVVAGEFVMPCYIELHPTNYCNQDCVWCIMREHRKQVVELSAGQLKTVALQMHENPEMKYIFLSGGGEPLTNDNLFLPYEAEGNVYESYFALLNGLGISIGMSSNGERLHRLIESGAYQYLDVLRISVDAGTEEQYAMLHRSKSGFLLQSLVKQIERYYSVSKKPVELSYLLHSRNKEGYLALAGLFENPEAVSCMKVKPLLGDAGPFREEHKEETCNGIRIAFAKEKEVPPYNFASHTNMLINAEGKVYSCCHMIDRGEEYLLGSIDDMPLRNLVAAKYPLLERTNCERCAGLEVNVLLNQFKRLEAET